MSGDDRTARRRSSDLERILNVAAERLAEHGYSATSLADISILGGLEPSVVTFHFPTKEDLVEAVLRSGVDRATAAISEATGALSDDATGADRLDAAIAAYLDSINAHQHTTRANIRCYRSVPPVVRRGLRVHMQEFVTRWESLIEAGQSDGTLRTDVDPPVGARMIIAALNASVTYSDEAATKKAAEQFRRILRSGLQAA